MEAEHTDKYMLIFIKALSYPCGTQTVRQDRKCRDSTGLVWGEVGITSADKECPEFLSPKGPVLRMTFRDQYILRISL